jgi:hypothetical protein
MAIFIFGRAEPVGRFEYLVHLLVSALLFGGFTALYLKSGKGDIATIANLISAMVMIEWIQCMGSRSRDAGLSRWVFGLALFVPLTVCGSLAWFNVLAWPYVLVLFVLTQIPVAFLRHKPMPV